MEETAPTKKKEVDEDLSTKKIKKATNPIKSVEGWIIIATGIETEETKEEDLMDKFSSFGQIRSLVFPLNKQTGNNFGYCLIEFTEKKEAMEAIRVSNGELFRGKKLVVDFAFTAPPSF